MPHTQADETLLPPIEKWSGKSLALIEKRDSKWQTPFEKANLTHTPNYDESINFLTKLASSEPRYHITSIGKSAQGRDIWMLIASQEGVKTPNALKANKKPTVLIQAGIHAGEIDGKDAGLMLLRDISKNNKAHLLNQVNLLFIPILNTDGHERSSPYNRVNQRGPSNMGWRTTAQNLNLNRDYAKADAPEMQALFKAINQWQPTLYLDIHVTDGEDYQYDITYGFNGEHGYSPNISRWLSTALSPAINQRLKEHGHLGGPLVFGMDKYNFTKGLFGWTATPRYSNGWGDIRHLPTILVENHSLKPYHQRVLGTYVFLEATINKLASDANTLKAAISQDIKQKHKTLTLAWSSDTQNPEYIDFQGIEYRNAVDPLTGIKYVEWTGKAQRYEKLPVYWSRIPKTTVSIPSAYYIPPQYQDVIHRLTVQGIKFDRLLEAKNLAVTQLTASNYSFGKVPFEGRLTVNAEFNANQLTTLLPAGTVRVPTSQKLGLLAVALLDPRGPDSLFSWGFFNQIFQQTEYIESYAMVPLAHKLLQQDATLKAAFYEKFGKQTQPETTVENNKNAGSLSELFSGESDEKMKWLYKHSKYYDNQHLKYPILMAY